MGKYTVYPQGSSQKRAVLFEYEGSQYLHLHADLLMIAALLEVSGDLLDISRLIKLQNSQIISHY